MDPRRGYQIDHFLPQKLRPELKTEYSNLLYLCVGCNNIKGAKLLPDPCEMALNLCLRFHDDGKVEAIEPYKAEGSRLIMDLELDDPRLIEYRRMKIGTIWTHAQHNPKLYVEMMGFPTDLPDLEADSPPGNTLPEGVQQSWLVRQRAGFLPLVY